MKLLDESVDRRIKEAEAGEEPEKKSLRSRGSGSKESKSKDVKNNEPKLSWQKIIMTRINRYRSDRHILFADSSACPALFFCWRKSSLRVV
jgi:hypothetical protein